VFQCGDRRRAIGQTRAALVEADHARKRFQSLGEPRKPRLFHELLDVRDETENDHEVERPTPGSLLRDADVTAAGVFRLGHHTSTPGFGRVPHCTKTRGLEATTASPIRRIDTSVGMADGESSREAAATGSPFGLGPQHPRSFVLVFVVAIQVTSS
jgi:hypothetical protein